MKRTEAPPSKKKRNNSQATMHLPFFLDELAAEKQSPKIRLISNEDVTISEKHTMISNTQCDTDCACE